MSDHYDSPPLHHELKFLQDTHALADRVGGVAHAVAQTFEEARIRTNVIGDVSLWRHEGKGALFVGDHRNGMEYAPLLALLGNLGREDCHFVTKPFSLSARVRSALGPGGAQMNLPVIPSTLASDRKDKINRDWYWRIKEGDDLPTKEEIHNLNSDTLHRCSILAGDGHAVVIYPAGGVMDALRKPWQRGLGSIIKNLPPEAHDDVTIVPFRFDHFSKERVLASLIEASKHMTPHPQTITLRLGRQGTINELLGNISNERPEEITAALREQFISFFGNVAYSR